MAVERKLPQLMMELVDTVVDVVNGGGTALEEEESPITLSLR